MLYPQLPDPDHPSLTVWTELVHAELAQLGDGERVVIAHSLAVQLWLQVAATLAPHQRVDRTLLVSPPSPRILAGYEEVSPFVGVRHDADLVARAFARTAWFAATTTPTIPKMLRPPTRVSTSTWTSSPVAVTWTPTPVAVPGRRCSPGATIPTPGSPN